MAVSVERLKSQEYDAIARICSEFGFSDTDDVPLSAIVRSAFLTLRDDPVRRQGEWQLTFGDVVTAAAALHDELKPFVPSGQLNNNGPARSVIERHIARALAGRPLPDPPKEGQ